MNKTVLISILILLSSHVSSSGQDQIGLYFCGITMHLLGDENSALMPLRLDDEALFVVNVGGALQYRKQLPKRFSIDGELTCQADCGFQPSVGMGISIGYDFIKSEQHQLIFALGPGFFFRNSWFILDGYIPVKELKISKNEKWEYLFEPVVPHVEYAFFPKSKKTGISGYCVFDPINVLGNVGFGVIYKLN